MACTRFYGFLLLPCKWINLWTDLIAPRYTISLRDEWLITFSIYRADNLKSHRPLFEHTVCLKSDKINFSEFLTVNFFFFCRASWFLSKYTALFSKTLTLQQVWKLYRKQRYHQKTGWLAKILLFLYVFTFELEYMFDHLSIFFFLCHFFFFFYNGHALPFLLHGMRCAIITGTTNFYSDSANESLLALRLQAIYNFV